MIEERTELVTAIAHAPDTARGILLLHRKIAEAITAEKQGAFANATSERTVEFFQKYGVALSVMAAPCTKQTKRDIKKGFKTLKEYYVDKQSEVGALYAMTMRDMQETPVNKELVKEIASVPNNAKAVVALHKKIAEAAIAAAEGVEENSTEQADIARSFIQYGIALHVMTENFSPKRKEIIREGLGEMAVEYGDAKNYIGAFYADRMRYWDGAGYGLTTMLSKNKAARPA